MDLKDKIIVVPGAAQGIGRAMCLRFATEGAKKVVCVDIDEAGAADTASQINGIHIKVDVSYEPEIKSLIDYVEINVGPIDLFCSNAGIFTFWCVSKHPMTIGNVSGISM